MSKDFYKVLRVARNATKEEIKKAYRKLAHKYHPDKGGDEKSFKEINEAYQILSDDRKRSQYDQFGQVFEGGFSAGGGSGFGGEWPGGFKFDFGAPFDQQGRGFADFDFSDIFEDFFSQGARTKSRERKGKDIKVDLSLPFEESVFGGKKEIELYKLSRCQHCQGSGAEPKSSVKTCPTCQGRGNIQKTQRTFLGSFTQVSTCQECRGTGKIPEILCAKCRGKGIEQILEHLDVFVPKGVRDGEILKITGKGEASLGGGIPGDLFAAIHVEPHKTFRRQEDDLVMQLPLKLSQAILGEKLEVNTLDGLISLKIPEGTQSGDILKVRGKGVFRPSGYGRGDLLIEIKVDTPRKISRKTKEIIEELRKEGL